MTDAIRKNAEIVIRQIAELHNVDLTYDEAAVAWLDEYIDQIKAGLSPEEIDNLIDLFGSFFGECLRIRYGGNWQEVQNQWAIVFDDRNAIFPFKKVAKKFRDEDESLRGLYRTVPAVFKEVLLGKHLDPGWLETLVQMLDVLQAHEYLARKYRTKGDAWYEMGSESRTIEYHNLAAEEERQARELAARIEETYGPDGGTDLAGVWKGPGEMNADVLPNPWSDPGGGFDEACFYARHPCWAQHAPRLAAAFARWKEDARLIREAPRYRPINPVWHP